MTGLRCGFARRMMMTAMGMTMAVAIAPALAQPAQPAPAPTMLDRASPSWPLQTKQYTGMDAPQDPATLPVSRAAVAAAPAPRPVQIGAPLQALSDARWQVGGWRLQPAPQVTAGGAQISRPGFDDSGWLVASVPGTVLTSLIANGRYADPAHGLNNLQVPEQLAQQDYWYRTEFAAPGAAARDQLALAFQGINYAAELWVNGQRLGDIRGAFTRGRFALPAGLAQGARMAVAVRVSPPPHPGLAHEESLKAGPGQNGGQMAVDGPTFAASEGWDWMPTVRDRETGLWQPVLLEASGPVRLGDAKVKTVLPKPDNSLAELTITVPVINQGGTTVTARVELRLGAAVLADTVTLAPHETASLVFAPGRFDALRIAKPALWWPNGYGKPVLHTLALTARVGEAVSDAQSLRFGMREISYELSAADPGDQLRRVVVTPDRGDGRALIETSHEKIRKAEGGWVVSLAGDAATSPAVTAVAPTPLAPHLVIRVNGVPIAVRGGNWGMDDWLKRVSRERMEPYFRLHREANVNTIRNWLGQSTEAVFFDLADEYGLLVLNDFWISTQDHNGEPGDSALFLANAADTVSRFQHHPSIALWIGRNEGVPPPVLNAGLEQLVREGDGTRLYLPNSRTVLMSNSGPWNYQPPEAYFTRLARGFSTEVGTPSFPTLETFKAMMPAADQWPISDSWAYHDWHQGKAGDVSNFMKAMAERFGAATDLVDFERKAQFLNYESHRAIFEGMNDGLFTRNSGRMLWMTHPAWPSTMWQIYSHDYDTPASFFGARKGMEPVHVQMNLPARTVAVANSLTDPIRQAQVSVKTYDLQGRLIGRQAARLDLPGLATTASGLAIDPALFDRSPVVLARLEFRDAGGRLISENFYWLGRDAAAFRALPALAPARISVTTRRRTDGGEQLVTAVVHNESTGPALMVRLSALDGAGARVLPAYWDDNYLTLLPGEQRTLTLRAPLAGARPASIRIDGWNVAPATRAIAGGRTGK
jgi:hypothetical protein